jgi:hypothetical protein
MQISGPRSNQYFFQIVQKCTIALIGSDYDISSLNGLSCEWQVSSSILPLGNLQFGVISKIFMQTDTQYVEWHALVLRF